MREVNKRVLSSALVLLIIGSLIVIFGFWSGYFSELDFSVKTIVLQKDVRVNLVFNNVSTVQINLYNAGIVSYKFNSFNLESETTRFSYKSNTTEIVNGQTFNLTIDHYWRPNIEYELLVKGVYGNETSYSYLKCELKSPTEYDYPIVLQEVILSGDKVFDELGIVKYIANQSVTYTIFNNSSQTYKITDIGHMSGVNRQIETKQIIEITYDWLWKDYEICKVFVRAEGLVDGRIAFSNIVYPVQQLK